jgi:dihydroorotase
MPAVTYELVVRGGEVVDPEAGLTTKADVAFLTGRIAVIGPALGDGMVEIDATGMLVTPGLIDLHVHVFEGVGDSTNVDLDCLGRGATTAVDAGSAGAKTFGAFRRVTADSQARTLAWLNLSTIGQVDLRVGELIARAHVDVDAAIEAARQNADVVVGLKARLSTYAAGAGCLALLRSLREASDALGLPVMVHIGDTDESLGEILEYLRPGDVVTHMFTGRKSGLLDGDGRLIGEARIARERGILFDAARGRNHISFRVMGAAVEQGFLPDSLSTDMSRSMASDSTYDLSTLASQLLSYDVTLIDVIRCLTTNPARAIRRPELARLQPGSEGDLTLLRLVEGRHVFRDVDGASRSARRRLVVIGAVRSGRYFPARFTATSSIPVRGARSTVGGVQ